MSFSAIVIAAIVMSALGLIFGALLGVTNRVFAIESDPKVDALRECLPGANCGACGFPGCDGYAAAVADGKAEIGACAVGGPACAKKMGEIMGVEASVGARMVATVACQGYGEHCGEKFDYQGIHDCVAASLVNNGTKSCQYACLGLGTCERACPFGAIHVDPVKKIAVVDKEKCQGCKKCVAACPQHVLSMQPDNRVVTVSCHNPEKGIALKEKCDKACIGCEACVKACNFGALTMENGVPKIDYEKCVGCMACADVCPTGAMAADYEQRKEAYIDPDKCVGCTICTKQCKFDAIEGALKQKHKVLGACTGCGLCAEKCPKKAITMRDRRAPRNKMDKVKKAPAAPAVKPAAPAEK
ncbi:MAG: RnfABCDGE type electron transport complex subunit B [Clostridia bacterium]|nr:RnfABCDGE type electron transport complex subunit B [Clostridia bacterium]